MARTSAYLPGGLPQLPFQWSLHVHRQPEAETEHYEFLATDVGDPRREFISSLCASLRDRGSIVVYAAFEPQAATIDSSSDTLCSLAGQLSEQTQYASVLFFTSPSYTILGIFSGASSSPAFHLWGGDCGLFFALGASSSKLLTMLSHSLGRFVRSLPIALGIPPQSGEGRREPGWRLGRCERLTKII
jgi:hypothetical protein